MESLTKSSKRKATKEELVNHVLERGVSAIYPTKDALRARLLGNKKVTLYLGVDPTGPTLHMGHAIVLKKLREFQELGHKIIFLIGDFTAMIGDPSDKSATRKKLTRDEVLANCKQYKKQASKFIDFSGKNPATIKFNSKWFSKMNFNDVLELASRFTVQQMLERDMFEKRMTEQKPIYIHEFMYPMMQGYDSVVMDVDLELCGNDQIFNALVGRTLMREMKGKEKFVIAMKLLADTTGKKMGKSEGNMIAFTDSPEDMYGKVMSWTDDMIASGFDLCTNVDTPAIEKVVADMRSGALNPRDAKMWLAYEIVTIYHDAESATRAQAAFQNTFQKKEIPDEVIEFKLGNRAVGLLDLLVETKLAPSKGQARRLVEQGGVKLSGEAVKDFNHEITASDEGIILQVGKRHFMKIVK